MKIIEGVCVKITVCGKITERVCVKITDRGFENYSEIVWEHQRLCRKTTEVACED